MKEENKGYPKINSGGEKCNYCDYVGEHYCAYVPQPLTPKEMRVVIVLKSPSLTNMRGGTKRDLTERVCFTKNRPND